MQKAKKKVSRESTTNIKANIKTSQSINLEIEGYFEDKADWTLQLIIYEDIGNIDFMPKLLGY